LNAPAQASDRKDSLLAVGLGQPVSAAIIVRDAQELRLQSMKSKSAEKALGERALAAWRQGHVSAWHEKASPAFKHLLGDLSLKPSPMFQSDLEVLEWAVAKDVADQAASILPRCKPTVRDELQNDWDRRHKLRRHVDCTPLPKAKRSLSACFRAGICLCEQQTLVKAHASLLSMAKTIFRAKSGPRTLADHSMIVLKFDSEAFTEPVWQHLSYANFNTWRLR
jgi:hypothetical protein